MSKFKVTLRRNGSAVGEMHYGSEAVAVTKAKAMKDATGCDVTVAPAKANRRRAATRRRNPKGRPKMRVGKTYALSVGDREIGTVGRMEDDSFLMGVLGRPYKVISKSEFEAWVAKMPSNTSWVDRESSSKSNPRRNPESTTLWTVRVGSQEIGEFHAPSRLTAAIAREAAKIAAEQGYTASMFKRWGSVSDGMHRHPVAAFLKNGHRCNPACGCPKSNRRRRNGAASVNWTSDDRRSLPPSDQIERQEGYFFDRYNRLIRRKLVEGNVVDSIVVDPTPSTGVGVRRARFLLPVIDAEVAQRRMSEATANVLRRQILAYRSKRKTWLTKAEAAALRAQVEAAPGSTSSRTRKSPMASASAASKAIGTVDEFLRALDEYAEGTMLSEDNRRYFDFSDEELDTNAGYVVSDFIAEKGLEGKVPMSLMRRAVDYLATRRNPRRRRNGTTAGEAAASRSLAHRAAMLLTR